MLRVNALAQVVRDGVKAIAPTLTPQVLEYLGATCAAMLEEKLGGVVRVQYFRDAVPMCAEWIRANISGSSAFILSARVSRTWATPSSPSSIETRSFAAKSIRHPPAAISLPASSRMGAGLSSASCGRRSR